MIPPRLAVSLLLALLALFAAIGCETPPANRLAIARQSLTTAERVMLRLHDAKQIDDDAFLAASDVAAIAATRLARARDQFDAGKDADFLFWLGEAEKAIAELEALRPSGEPPGVVPAH